MAKDASHDAVVRFEEEHNDDNEARKVGTSNDSIGVDDGGVNEGSSSHSRENNATTSNRSKYSSAINTEGGDEDEVCSSVGDSWNATTPGTKSRMILSKTELVSRPSLSLLLHYVPWSRGLASNSVPESRGGNVAGTDSERGTTPNQLSIVDL